MNTNHTPGPWISEQNGELPDRPWTVGKLFYCIADVGNESDAKLIAQAPALLAALEEMVSHFAPFARGGSYSYLDAPVNTARAVIAQAKGETR